MRKLLCPLLCLLWLLGGCGREVAAVAVPPPSQPPNAAGEAAPIPASHPAEEDENPYADMPESRRDWLYDVWEAYRGSEEERLSETREFTWLEYSMAVSRSDENSGGWHNARARLPQCPGDDPFAVELSRYYGERYDAFLKEERAYLEGCAANWAECVFDEMTLGLTMEDEFLWKGFYQVILSDIYGGWRIFHEPVVDLFDVETGQKLTDKELFSGPEETWGPALRERLEQSGRLAATGEVLLGMDPTYVSVAGVEDWETQNYLLTPNGLGVAFRTGSVSFIGNGPVVVLVPYEAVADLMTPDLYARLSTPL